MKHSLPFFRQRPLSGENPTLLILPHPQSASPLPYCNSASGRKAEQHSGEQCGGSGAGATEGGSAGRTCEACMKLGQIVGA